MRKEEKINPMIFEVIHPKHDYNLARLMLTTVILKMGCKYFSFIDVWVIESCFVKGHLK